MDVAQTALRLNAATGEDEQDEHTPIDVAETAARLGFREVTVVYRRSEAEMPARKEEVESAKEEGTRFRFLTAPVRFIGDEKSRVVAMECIEMELGKPDARGRRERPDGDAARRLEGPALGPPLHARDGGGRPGRRRKHRRGARDTHAAKTAMKLGARRGVNPAPSASCCQAGSAGSR